MSDSNSPGTDSKAVILTTGTDGPVRQGPKSKHRFSLGMDRYSGLYVIAVLIIVFALWKPDTFLTTTTLKSVADQQSITALLALALIIPMAAGAFDISVSATMALSVVLVAKMQSSGYSVLVSMLGAVLVGAVIGAINGFVVVKLSVNSFVATLGTGSVITGVAFWAIGGQPIVSGFDEGFMSFGQFQLFGVIPIAVVAMTVVAVVLWAILEHTPAGRYLYATGSNAQAARLAGLRVDRIVFGSLVASAVVASGTGVLLMSKIGIGSHEIGAPYLLPVFAAAFLGATQIHPGRVNVAGTIIAVYLLAIGVKGLQLAGAASFVADIFNGLALVIAVALASRQKKFGLGPI